MSAELNIPNEAIAAGWHEFRYPRPAVDKPSAAFLRGLKAFDMINVFTDDPAVIRDAVRAGLAHGAAVNKTAKGDQWFTAELEWGPVSLHINARREEVCEKIVVGTREVTEEVPDPEALAAVPTVTVTRAESVTKWVCKPILATADTETAVAS